MTDSRDEHEPYGFTESPVIAKMQAEIARLTAERDEARRDAERWQADALRLLNEIDRLRQDADENARTLTETRRAVETLTTELEMWRDGNIMAESHRDEIAQLERTAEVTYENHKRIVAELTAERDESRRDAERWEDDALRLMNERNAAQKERDEARRELCYASHLPPRECAADRGWDCFKESDK
jgi:chromosome segregation ATPase